MKPQYVIAIGACAFRKQHEPTACVERLLDARLNGMSLACTGAINKDISGESGNPSNSRPGEDFPLRHKSARSHGAKDHNVHVAQVVGDDQAGSRRHAFHSHLNARPEYDSAAPLLQNLSFTGHRHLTRGRQKGGFSQTAYHDPYQSGSAQAGAEQLSRRNRASRNRVLRNGHNRYCKFSSQLSAANNRQKQHPKPQRTQRKSTEVTERAIPIREQSGLLELDYCNEGARALASLRVFSLHPNPSEPSRR